jgi:hypothetical protein
MPVGAYLVQFGDGIAIGSEFGALAFLKFGPFFRKMSVPFS